MNIRREHLRAFESLLVKEFRACQALFGLTREERQVLSRIDVPRLLELAERKEALLDQLGKLEDTRRILLHSLGDSSSIATFEGETAALAAVLGTIDKDEADRLIHLQEGVLVLMSQMRELNHGNRALASCALERANVLQTHLAKLWQFPTSWEKGSIQVPVAFEGLPQATGAADPINLPAIFATIVSVRHALKAKDQAAISVALSELQDALERLGEFLGEERFLQAEAELLHEVLEEAQSDRQGLPASQEGANLIEVMADLHQQEAAYQAILRVSNRMLASV